MVVLFAYSDLDAAGIRFNGSIQVPLVQSNRLDDELNILSPTRRIRIRGPQKCVLKSFSSDSTIYTSAVNNVEFRSKEKMVSFVFTFQLGHILRQPKKICKM